MEGVRRSALRAERRCRDHSDRDGGGCGGYSRAGRSHRHVVDTRSNDRRRAERDDGGRNGWVERGWCNGPEDACRNALDHDRDITRKATGPRQREVDRVRRTLRDAESPGR